MLSCVYMMVEKHYANAINTSRVGCYAEHSHTLTHSIDDHHEHRKMHRVTVGLPLLKRYSAM